MESAVEKFNRLISKHPDLAKTCTGLTMLRDLAWFDACMEEIGVNGVMQDLDKLSEMQREADINCQLRDRLAEEHAAQVDAVIGEGIDRILGKGNWNLEKIQGRLTKMLIGGGVWVYRLDGQDFLELHPHLFTGLGSTGKRKTLSLESKYRYLGLAALGEDNAGM